MSVSLKTLLALTAPLAVLAASGNGKSTRYWDCCKPSCAWPGKAAVSSPALTCDKNDNPLGPNAQSGCNGGNAFTCSNNSPWAVNENLAYGFAATAITGGNEGSWCCACYALSFTSGPVAGKTMIVQSTNTGGDLGENHFDIQMPGGGVGIFDGCTPQFGGLPGERYGGISSRSQCDTFPELLKDGCYWRFDWFKNADNPNFKFEQVQCPAALTAVSGCVRNDDKQWPVFAGAGGSTPPKSSSVALPPRASSSPASPPRASSSPATPPRASSSAAAPPPPAPPKSSSLATLIKASTSPAPPKASTPPANSSPAAPMWGQCGGIGWSGPTTCIAGARCLAQNPWYSQCLA